MVLQNRNKTVWDPPSEHVNKPNVDGAQRLSMSNFKLNRNPFYFEIGSTESSETVVSTMNQTTFLMDKFLQVDFKLGSQKIFGLGERNRGFKLTQGVWTMWANG
jgi:hypothetical protein